MINQEIKEPSNITFLKYDQAVALMKEKVDKALLTSPHIIRQYTVHLSGSNGKFIRALSILTCALNKENLIHPNAVLLAAAVEVLHLATLVHDDIIDDADIRRGITTLHKKYDKKTAVICGDYLLCKALAMCASVPNKEDYLQLDMPDYMSRICFGELRQHINNGNLDLSIYSYLKIISGKTAALFEASFYAGAVLCEAEKKEIYQYKRLGHYIGMIFQLSDDCMDFDKTEQIAKKPVQSDFEQNVITLPLIHAFRNMENLKKVAKGLTRIEINAAVQKTGGILYTHNISKKYYEKSLKIIDRLTAANEKKDKLKAILNQSFRI